MPVTGLDRKKTSISLPTKLAARWKKQQNLVIQHLPKLLAHYHQAIPRRDRFRRYAIKGARCEIVSVYWDMQTYNKLHAVATALRMSVSLLISEILNSFGNAKPEGCGVLNYGFQVVEWSDMRMAFAENLDFYGTPPPLTP